MVARLHGRSDALASLRAQGYTTIISWYGTSGSYQGGFVLPATLLVSLGQLGCDVYGNVHAFEDGDEVQ